ncbi:MAG TPA: hypothetical protein PK529_14010 [Verrucomicrobiales bacterium]|nr:hypothetical protein [Verrucomicrobiales bacterium]
MSILDAILLVIQVLSMTFVAVLLLAAIVVFQNTDEKVKPEKTLTAWQALWEIQWHMEWGGIVVIANVFRHWNENPDGRRCIYGSAIALAFHFGTYLID